jgi:hypothetical protein
VWGQQRTHLEGLRIILIWVYIPPLVVEKRVDMLGECVALIRVLRLVQSKEGSRHEHVQGKFWWIHILSFRVQSAEDRHQ